MEYTKGKLKCGCKAKTTFNPDNYSIIFCPLHKSAPDLYEACKIVRKHLIKPEEILPSGAEVWAGDLLLLEKLLDKALAKAEGK